MRTRTVRQAWKHKGRSVYAVEVREPAPTFNRGDGYDSGRNLLGAALIGPRWCFVGYVVGARGEWYAYQASEQLGGVSGYPVCDTVAAGADRLLASAGREA